MASLKAIEYLKTAVTRLCKAAAAYAVMQQLPSQLENSFDILEELDSAESQYNRAIQRLKDEI